MGLYGRSFSFFKLNNTKNEFQIYLELVVVLGKPGLSGLIINTLFRSRHGAHHYSMYTGAKDSPNRAGWLAGDIMGLGFWGSFLGVGIYK